MDNINPNPQKKEKRKIVLVDTEHVAESEARDFADMSTTAEKSTLKGFKGFFKKMWKHNIAREYYHQKEIVKARKSIYEKENVFANQEIDKNAHKEAMDAIVERFESEYEDMIDREAGESKDKLPEGHETNALKSGLQYLIRRYASGEISEGSFEEEKKRQLAFFREAFPKALPSAKMFADNIFEIAKESRQAVEHGMSIDELDLDFDIVLGKAKSALRTEANFTVVDKAIDKIKRVPILGHLFNETTVALVASSFLFTSKKILSSKVASLITFGGSAVVASSFAGMIENMRVKAERRQHLRERAKGMTFEAGAERREEMEKTQYDMVNAKATIDQLTSLLASIKSEGAGNESERALQDKVNEMLAELSDLEARIKIGNEKKIDLIAYSNITEVEKEKKDLLTIRAEAKVELRRLLALYPSLRTPTGQHFDAYLTSQIEAEIRGLKGGEAGIEAKDKLFRKMKRKKVGAMMGKTFIAGLLIGTAAQEIGAAVSSEQQGLVDSIIGKEDVVGHSAHMTPLGGAAQEVRDLFTGHHMHMSMDNAHTFDLNGAHMNLPEGVDMVANPDGTVDILRDGAPFAEDVPLSFDADGSLTQASIDALRGHGIDASFEQLTVINGTEITESPSEYIDHHPDATQNADRTLWYDNDTPKPVFDQNELKLWWGAPGNDGIDADGNYVFNVEHMTSGGSFHDSLSVDAQKLLAEGKLKMQFSLSSETQDHVFQVPIDTNGNAIIDPDSEIGKLFFENSNGHAVFLGRYAEVVQSMGTVNGVEQVHVLATHVGHGLDSVKDTIPGPAGVNTIGVPVDYDIYPPPFIPVVGRRPLEPGVYKNFNTKVPLFVSSERGLGPYGYGYGYGSEGGDFGLLDRSKYDARMSKLLLKDSNLDVSKNDKKVIKEYLEKQDKEYLKELEEMIRDLPPMKDNIEVVITLPAYLEGKNLEKTIRNYAKMNNHEKFEVVILENHPKSKERDNTEEIISKMKIEFPDMNLVHVYKVFDEKPTIGEVRKYLVDSVLVRKQKAGISKSITIVSNDADLEGIDKDYANHISKAFKEDDHLDAVGAKWDFPKNDFEKLPILHASQRLWHYFDIVFRYNYMKSPELIGRNSAFRSGIYAAIGGYNETSRLAEDLEIGWLIKNARKYDVSRIKYLNNASLKSNSRRAVGKMLSGGRLIQQYGDFHENEEVRNAPLEELLKDKKDFDLEVFKLEVQSIYDYYKKWKKSNGGWIDDKYIDESFERAMSFVGVKFSKDNENINILDTSKLENSLNKNIDKLVDVAEKDNDYTIGDLDTPEVKVVKKSPKKGKVGKAERKETKTKETEGLSLNKDTDLIYSRMMSNPLDLNTEVASRVKRYKKPTFVIFEQDKTKRADFEKQIKVTQKKYPDAYIEYVKLPDDMSTISGVSANEYMKSVIENSSSEVKLDARVEKRLINPKITF